MFNVGEYVVYGSTGVCRVDEITKRSFGPGCAPQDYYKLNPLYSSEIIYTPVDGTKVFIRPVISREEAERLVELIPTVEAEAFHSRSAQELSSYYQQALRSHDCTDLIEMIVSIYSKRQIALDNKKRLGQVDDHFMKRAEAMLHGELSVALGIPVDEIQKHIASRAER